MRRGADTEATDASGSAADASASAADAPASAAASPPADRGFKEMMGLVDERLKRLGAQRDDDVDAEEEDNVRADDPLSDSEEDWWNEQQQASSSSQPTGVKVQIFFTRNSQMIGKKDTTQEESGYTLLSVGW